MQKPAPVQKDLFSLNSIPVSPEKPWLASVSDLMNELLQRGEDQMFSGNFPRHKGCSF